jgi:tetratricopeptide (TPR) repeat protein
VGLHLLRGLVLAAQRRDDAAAEAIERELSGAGSGQLYARECAANSWYALGAIRLRQRRRDDAASAFGRALAVVPGHRSTLAALGQTVPSFDRDDPRVLDAALARAAGLARAGRHADAALAYRTAVTNAPWPAAGWILPVEPLIDAGSRRADWAEALALVSRRAW